ncbi:MAG: DNA mismatch repair protein MutS, partial [Desulfovibrio sp.]|nr:DNA mismatch repair protein MutS [Desulfovibrio sp.]
MSDDQAKLTPVLNQYKSVKKQYPDALLFFRMGDFYELFFDDARVASAELQLALTSRNKNDPNFVPMCGFPWHAAQPYLTQLLEKGYNVAICEQIGDPKTTKGIVERAVTRVVTPATALDDAALGAKTHNYLGAVCMGLHSCGFVWADISTGQWSGLEFKRQSDMWTWVGKLAPRELLIPDGQQAPATLVQAGIRVVHQPAVNFELKRGLERVLEVQEVREAGALGLDDKPSLTRACGALIAYIQQTQVTQPVRLLPFKPMDLGKRLIIDDLTEKNLEIFVRLNGQKGKGTLREVIDETLTPMGGRLMEDMLRHPWRDIKRISQIQESAAWLMANDDIRESLRTILADLRDLERIITRIILNRGSFRDLLALRQSAEQLPRLKDLLTADDAMASGLRRAGSLMDDLSDCAELLRSALADSEAEGAGGMFRSGYCASLDEQIELAEHGENKLRELLETERQKTGITRLKLGYNRVFGYFFEAPRSGLSKELPERFVRRQTLANGERFATEELKQLEDDILQAGERRKELENELFLNLLEHVGAQKERVLQTADLVAQIDYWQSLAHVARRDGWVMPELTEENEIHIREGRHPVIENIVGQANFVANDFHMDKNRGTCLITGPNMAGKSTNQRQVDIIGLLSQI